MARGAMMVGEGCEGGNRVAPVAASRDAPSYISASSRRWRSATAVVFGCALAACVLASVGMVERGGDDGARGGIKGGAVELEGWPFGRDPNVIRDGPRRKKFEEDSKALQPSEAVSISQGLVKAGEDMKRVNKFVNDQYDFNGKLTASMNALEVGFNSSLAEARAEGEKMTEGLHKMNKEAVAGALKSVTDEISAHAAGTEKKIRTFATGAMTRVDAQKSAYSADMAAISKQIGAADAKQAVSRWELDRKKGELQAAILAFEKGTSTRLEALSNRIMLVRGLLATHEKKTYAALEVDEKEARTKLGDRVKAEHDAAVIRMTHVQMDVMDMYTSGMKELEGSIETLRLRSEKEGQVAKDRLERTKERHTQMDKELNALGDSTTVDLADASKKVSDMAAQLQALVNQLNNDITKARTTLKSESSASVADITAKVGNGVKDLHKMLDEKNAQFGQMRGTVRQWLQEALRLEDQSKYWRKDQQEQSLTDLANQYAKAEEGVAALERIVHVLDGQWSLEEDTNKNEAAPALAAPAAKR